MIPLGLEPKAYCLEGSCSIQLSYGTNPFANAAAKLAIFSRTTKFSDCKSYVGAVVERIITFGERFGGLEHSDVQRVGDTLVGKPVLRCLERGLKVGIAVGSQDDFPRLEIEGEHSHMLLGYGEAVDYGISFVLLLHRLKHVRNNGGTSGIVGEEMLLGLCALCDDGGTLFG